MKTPKEIFDAIEKAALDTADDGNEAFEAAACKIIAEAQAEILAVLKPFAEPAAAELEEFERWRAAGDDPLPADDERAEAIYAWALAVTYSDIRRAAALFAEDKEAVTARVIRNLLDPVQSPDKTS